MGGVVKMHESMHGKAGVDAGPDYCSGESCGCCGPSIFEGPTLNACKLSLVELAPHTLAALLLTCRGNCMLCGA